MVKGLDMRFTVRIRRVGGSKNRRPAIGLTIPQVVCQDLNLKIGDHVEVYLFVKNPLKKD